MRDSDVLDNNPHVSRSALEAMHGQVFGWALSRCNYEQAVAEDLVQQAYVELLTGKARFDGASSLKTFVFAVVQNLALSFWSSYEMAAMTGRSPMRITSRAAWPSHPSTSGIRSGATSEPRTIETTMTTTRNVVPHRGWRVVCSWTFSTVSGRFFSYAWIVLCSAPWY